MKIINFLFIMPLLSGCSYIEQIKDNTISIANNREVIEGKSISIAHEVDQLKESMSELSDVVSNSTRANKASKNNEPPQKKEVGNDGVKAGIVDRISKVIVNNDLFITLINKSFNLEVAVSTTANETTKNLTNKITNDIANNLRSSGLLIKDIFPVINNIDAVANPLIINVKLLEPNSKHVVLHYDIVVNYHKNESGGLANVRNIVINKIKYLKPRHMVKITAQ
jgi:hypothetical protein